MNNCNTYFHTLFFSLKFRWVPIFLQMQKSLFFFAVVVEFEPRTLHILYIIHTNWAKLTRTLIYFFWSKEKPFYAGLIKNKINLLPYGKKNQFMLSFHMHEPCIFIRFKKHGFVLFDCFISFSLERNCIYFMCTILFPLGSKL